MAQIYIVPHKKIGYIFLVLTILMLAGVIFGLSFISYGAEIIITPEAEEVDVNFLLTVKNSDKESEYLEGWILENLQEAQEKSSPKATVSMEDYAEGEIILTNNTWNPVNFVATTRFLSPEGLIFRAVDKIYIPAKGETSVLVRADKMGKDYEIGPSKFTIPNLTSPSLKENIIAESKEPMTGGIKSAGVVMASDIDELKANLKDKLYKKGVSEIESRLAEQNLKIIILSNVLEEACDTKANEEKAEFTVTTKMKIGAAAVREKELLDAAIKKLEEKIPPGKDLFSYEQTSLSARLKEYNAEAQVAVLEVQLRGQMIINKDHESLEKNRFKGLSSSDIKNYFKDYKEIKEVKVKFWPPFLKKSPEAAEKIKIRILR